MSVPNEAPLFDPRLIERFEIKGPRYTSYPTADRFQVPFDASVFRNALENRSPPERPLSLYVHLPFCASICYYCACNRIITGDHGRSSKYLKYLGREIALLTGHLRGGRQVVQLHWGGGSPNFLSDAETRQLMALIRHFFDLQADGEFSIEIDPRQVDSGRIALLGDIGFNRISVGVQDFDPAVQAAIHRRQTLEETARVIEAARDRGFKSISVDLIYGLPRQTLAGFARTLDQVIALRPDRLSVYNFAYLPQLFKPQRRIAEADLPSASTRLNILALAIRTLTEAGYVYIGMDHFARPQDELAVAQRQGRLHRNFQGYSTHADCDLLAIGISAISKVGTVYSQNGKTLDEYYGHLDRGELPVARGYELSTDDLLRRAVIQALMCQFELEFAAIEKGFGISFAEYFVIELQELRELEAAGMVSMDGETIQVLPAGRLLVRAVAMVFDRYLRADHQKTRYSKVI
ncbi:MAG: Oxygen-independent coproporphyrinogen-III oxidase [Betaproteobacteria bacterium ADurb.Bin341]|nr:MAG: Oxygen-independent coproporphyrinogen-III oxidase [Betaproteobacteria bacterium ADurb.Bin341]